MDRRVLGVLHDAVGATSAIVAAVAFFDPAVLGRERNRYRAGAGFCDVPGTCRTESGFLKAKRVEGIALDAWMLAPGWVEGQSPREGSRGTRSRSSCGRPLDT